MTLPGEEDERHKFRSEFSSSFFPILVFSHSSFFLFCLIWPQEEEDDKDDKIQAKSQLLMTDDFF